MDENVRITIENNFVIWPFCLKEELLQTNYMYIQSKKSEIPHIWLPA